MPVSQNSSSVGTRYAKESSLNVLPGTPVWKEVLVNTFSDFGGKVTTVARNPFNPSRQMRKGGVTDLDVSGGINLDFTQNNLTELLQGVLYAAAREKFSTEPLNGTAIAITGVNGTTEQYTAASGLDVVLVGSLMKASNFEFAVNNGLKTVNTVAAAALTVDEDLVDETPGSTAKLEVVGFAFPTGDLTLTYSNNQVLLGATATDLTTLGLNIGEWLFIGGDATINKFANNTPFYGRIRSITTTVITIDMVIGAIPTTDTGAGKEIHVFFQTFLRNEKDPALIVRTSYQFERTLGSDDDGVQSEYITGAVANEFKQALVSANKLTSDLMMMACRVERRTGLTGVKAGTRVDADFENMYNLSSDVFAQILYTYADGATGFIESDGLFSYVEDGEVVLKNNLVANKAIGVLGAFEITAGDFEGTGNMTVYFEDFVPIEAVFQNKNAAYHQIVAGKNSGFVFDLPLITLADARPNPEKGQAIKLPLEIKAFECANGYTASFTFFNYLPDAAMPVAV